MFFIAVVFFSAYNGLLLKALELPLAVVYLGIFFYSLTVLFAVMSLMAKRENNKTNNKEQQKPPAEELIPTEKQEEQQIRTIAG